VFWSLVVLGVFLSWKEYKENQDNNILLLIIWSVVIFAATLAQRRFGYYLAVNAALMMAFLITRTIFYYKIQRVKLFTYVFTGIMVLSMLPTAIIIGVGADEYAPSDDWGDTLKWVKENTPREAVITSWWDNGYWIEYLGERRTVVNPSQNPELIKRVARVLTSPYDNAFDGVEYLILDESTMNGKYGTVKECAGVGSTKDSLAIKLWEGNKVDGISLVYDTPTVKVYRRDVSE
jgi:asparagine N-glycosylation enzyme membrane subunit Stt3